MLDECFCASNEFNCKMHFLKSVKTEHRTMVDEEKKRWLNAIINENGNAAFLLIVFIIMNANIGLACPMEWMN